MTDTQEFIVTFGQKYRHESHPRLGNIPQLPDGYGIIHAHSYEHACRLAQGRLDIYYAFVYLPGTASLHLYPAGPLLHIGTPTK